MKNIVTIEYEIPGYSDSYKEFNSKSSLLDYDIIILSSNFYYDYYTFHNGKPSYSNSSSFEVQEDSEHWKREILYCLDSGKTIFVILDQKKEFYIYTGRQDYSGTGRNRETISYVSDFDNYQFLPINDLKFITSKGDKIKSPKHSVFLDFFKTFKNNLEYRVYIESNEGDTIFTTYSGNKSLGMHFKKNSGNLILLPYIDYDEEEFLKVDADGNQKWNSKAIGWGKKLISNLIEIDNCLSSLGERTPRPDWVLRKKYQIKQELALDVKINSQLKKISKFNKDVDAFRKDLNEISKLKDLLYETGKNLENAVIKSLKILGYQAEGYDDGILELDQIILSPEGTRFIGECEGKDNKAIEISKFRQLADAINEDFERKEVGEEAIGILFGNPFRLQEPDTRKEFFTNKCISAANRRGYALIKTIDLYDISKYIFESDDMKFKKLCREAILKCLGKIVSFPKIPEINK